MDHQRPRRYRQAGRTAPRAPPQYLRRPDPDEDDEDERARTNALKKILNVLAVFGIITLLFLTAERFSRVNGRDPYGCAAMTNEGRWLESNSNTTDPLRTWQPLGCLLHKYSGKDIATCLPKRRILFVGDRGIQSLYHATVDKLQPGTRWGELELDKKFTSEGLGDVTVEFVWDPYLNSTRLAEELKPWNNGTVETKYQMDGNYDTPALFIVGAGIRFAQRGFDENPLRVWREAVDRVARHMRWGDRPIFLGGKDMLMLAPVEQPAWEKLQPDVKKSLVPSVALDMNKYLTSIAAIQGVDVVRAWKVSSDDNVDLVVSNHIYSKYHSKETKGDGIELLEEVAARRVDMVLGLRCNSVLKEIGESVPGNCCVSPRELTWLQGFMMFRGLLVILALRVWLWWYDGKLQNKQKTHPATLIYRYGPGMEVLSRLWRLSLVLTLCLYADRSPIFYHMEQLWSTIKFRKALFFVVVMGIFTLRKPALATTVWELDKRILTEWKGAALAIHLVSSYLGGSTDFSTFALIFVNSIGWTISLLTANSPRTGGLYFARKLVGINYVVLPMVFMMRTEYVLYRVPALLSFWFVIIYMTIKIRSWGNKDLEWYAGKVVLSAILVAVLFRGLGAHTVILRVLEVLCAIRWDGELVKELVFKHMGAAYLGMGLGWVYVSIFLLSKGGETARNERYAACLALFLGILYFLLKVQGFDWLDRWHTCSSLARIAGFGVIRLGLTRGRMRQSEFLTWLGNMEAAVLGMMNHLWLAAGGEAVLDLGFWGFNDAGVNWNWGFWTLVFGYLCWVIGDARETVVNWVLGFHGEPVDKLQDRKKTDIDAMEMVGGDGHGDVELGRPQQTQPPSKGPLEQFASKGVLRAVGILLAVWILNWMT
ncbi:uncharacterized protein DFL_001635 [Arthrobotrys flagrans]|uniref:Cas1p 10 TM acyl transferase domain-containing protein n=1 Tax=Arthrobotrys flagrans TaxID=97331 RepID=A0A437A863_ARTFL|nr:hypothetical protein DFL_001635 [Arthrobotrys flagrans]